MLPVKIFTIRSVKKQVFEKNQLKIATSFGSRRGNCGNVLELKVLTQLHHVH